MFYAGDWTFHCGALSINLPKLHWLDKPVDNTYYIFIETATQAANVYFLCIAIHVYVTTDVAVTSIGYRANIKCIVNILNKSSYKADSDDKNIKRE